MNNLLTFSLLGLVGGVLFEVLGDWFDLGLEDTAYALLALPIYLLLSAINLAMVTVMHPELPAWGAGARVLGERCARCSRSRSSTAASSSRSSWRGPMRAWRRPLLWW